MILIIGAGAVGTVLAAHLMAAHREPVRLYAREKDFPVLRAVQSLRVEHAGASHPPIVTDKPTLTHSLDLDGVDYLLLCVKYPQLDCVLAELPAPPPGCTAVCALNGVGAPRRIRQQFPAARVLPLTVMFNARLLEPLHAQITTRAQLLLAGEDRRLCAAFAGSGMHVRCVRGTAMVWGKLLINLANAPCALTRGTFKDMLTDRDLRRIFVALLDEAVAALDAAGVDYRLPLPLPLWAYRTLLAGNSRLPWWLARLRNGLQDDLYPSMVADVIDGRPTEVAQLNGEIVCLGLEHRIPTPVNARVLKLIQSIEGRADPPPFTPAQLRERLEL